MSGRTALIVRGGWSGHSPVETTERFRPFLAAAGYECVVSDSLTVYADRELMGRVDLVVQSWTMGTVEEPELDGLRAAVARGTGLAGWHGGIVDSFRAASDYLHLIGGQFACHPGGFVDHTVEIAPGRADHPIIAGIDPFAVHTEQYWVLTDAHNDVLATTTHPANPGDPWASPVTVPAVWTRTWGAGRIFVCTIGHSPADLDIPEVRTVIERGLRWASR